MAALSLAFDILARDQNATRTFNNVGDSAERAGKRGEKFGKAMKAGMAVAATAIAAAGAGLVAFAAESVTSLARIERINAQTAAAIKSMGGAAGVSAKQVEDLAGALENKTATEAESIQQGANLLLTFGNIKNSAGENNDIFNQTVIAVTDMSRALDTTGAATLDQSAAAVQLGKALNDPIKGVTALQKVGVSFTAQQKETIKSLVEGGDVMGAQKLILSELTKQFGGSAEAFAQTTTGRIELAKHAIGTLGETITASLLPTLGNFATKAADWLNGLAEGFENGTGAGGRLREAFERISSGLTIAKDAAVGLYNILFKGDFTGGFSPFGIEEDSKFIGYLFTVRDTFQAIAAHLKDLWESAQTAGDTIKTALLPVWNTITALWESDLKPALMELWTVLKDQLGPIFGENAAAQGPFIEQMAKWIAVIIEQALPTITAVIKGLAQLIRWFAAIVPPIVAAWQASVEFGIRLYAMAVSARASILTVVNAVVGFGTSVVNGFNSARTAVTNEVGSIVSTLKGLPGQVTGALGDFSSLLYDKGRALIQGLINGITAKIAAVRSAMSSVAGAIGDFLPGSPVKTGPLTKWNNGMAGKRLLGMLESGLSDTRGVESAMQRVTSRIQAPVATAGVAGGGGGSKMTRVTVPLMVGGKALGEAVLDFMDGDYQSGGAV